MKKQYILVACLAALCACAKNEPAPQKQQQQDNRPQGGCCETPKAKLPEAPQAAQATTQGPQAVQAPQAAPQVTQTIPEVKAEKTQ